MKRKFEGLLCPSSSRSQAQWNIGGNRPRADTFEMGKTMAQSGWEEIHGFASQSEYSRFVKYIEEQVSSGYANEIPADPNYGEGMIFGGRWFKDKESGQVWRLVGPDFPFKGLWEPVK